MTQIDCLIDGLRILKKYGATDFSVEEPCDDDGYLYVQAKEEPSDDDTGALMALGWDWYYGANPNGTFTVYKNAWVLK